MVIGPVDHAKPAVMDNTASPVSFTKAMREGGFDKEKLKLTLDEVFTPPMSDRSAAADQSEREADEAAGQRAEDHLQASEHQRSIRSSSGTRS